MMRWLELNRLAVLTAAVLVVLATPAAAQRAYDTGWFDVSPESFDTAGNFNGVLIDRIAIWEKRTRKSDELAVVNITFALENTSEFDLFFDIDLLGVDKDGEVLFVFKLSPSLLALRKGTVEKISQSRYVTPGALDKVANYRARYIGQFPPPE